MKLRIHLILCQYSRSLIEMDGPVDTGVELSSLKLNRLLDPDIIVGNIDFGKNSSDGFDSNLNEIRKTGNSGWAS